MGRAPYRLGAASIECRAKQKSSLPCAGYTAYLRTVMAALAPAQPTQAVQLLVGGAAVAARVQAVTTALDTSMEAVQLCNCHSQPVISAADLARSDGAPGCHGHDACPRVARARDVRTCSSMSV